MTEDRGQMSEDRKQRGGMILNPKLSEIIDNHALAVREPPYPADIAQFKK